MNIHIMEWAMSFKQLPYSTFNYTVYDSGKIFINNKELDYIVDEEDDLCVSLNWISGFKSYKVSTLLLIAFNKVGLDIIFYNKILPIYLDGDNRNLFLSNLTYIHTEPIESNREDYYLVPGFENYAINKNGDLINLDTGVNKIWTLTKGDIEKNKKPGYKYSVLYRNSTVKTVYQHRLLCLIFKKFIGILNNLTVNHKDGNKSNNNLDNLEWVTYSENNKHAWDNGLKFDKKPKILMLNLVTREISSFRSIRECSSFIGDETGFYVSERLKDTSNKIYPDLLMFKLDDNKPWNIPKLINVEISSNPIVARNVFTGNIVIFEDISKTIEYFDTPAWMVLEHARKNKLIPYNGYNFRYLAFSKLWTKHSRKHLESYKADPKNPRDGIIMVDASTSKETYFPNAIECQNKMKIEKTHLYTLLNSGRMFQKRYTFKWFKLFEELEKDNQQPSYSFE